MRIAYDAKRITNNRTGLGNYSRFVVRILSDAFPDNEYLLLSPSAGDHLLYEELLATKGNVIIRTPHSFIGKKVKVLWRNFRILPFLRRRGTDLYHGLSNELPMGLWRGRSKRPKTVVTIHDLAFIRHPSFYTKIDHLIYRWKYGTSAQAADHIIAVSEFTKQDIIRFLGIPEEKISVVYQGCSPRFAEASHEDATRSREIYHLPTRYMLFVGSIEERKNLKLAVEALA
ncbi:MAG: mannosyltransferase, partial [Bacteroidetes bacterium]